MNRIYINPDTGSLIEERTNPDGSLTISCTSKGLLKCETCKWANPETCRICLAQQKEGKVLVLAVNKGGIKQ